MTDLEKFIELYKSVGIKLEVYEGGQIKRNGGNTLCVEISSAVCGDSVIGHIDRLSVIAFDGNGKFIHQGLW